MDQLVEQIVQKTGISPEHARTAVTTVLGFLKGRLPGPLASQLDGILGGSGQGQGGESGGGGGLGDVAKNLGGMFGGGK